MTPREREKVGVPSPNSDEMEPSNNHGDRADGDRPQKSAEARVGDGSPGHGAKTEAVRQRAVLALLSERTVASAARRCGVNEKTLRRWMADDDEFKQELADARRAMFQAGMNRVQALTAVAIDTFATLMGRGMPPTVRLGAARTVAELGIHQHFIARQSFNVERDRAFVAQKSSTKRVMVSFMHFLQPVLQMRWRVRYASVAGAAASHQSRHKDRASPAKAPTIPCDCGHLRGRLRQVLLREPLEGFAEDVWRERVAAVELMVRHVVSERLQPGDELPARVVDRHRRIARAV